MNSKDKDKDKDKDIDIDKFYLDHGKKKMNLEGTRLVAVVWSAMIKENKWVERLAEIESVITDNAKIEWGEQTDLKFDRQDRKITFINSIAGREKEIQF